MENYERRGACKAAKAALYLQPAMKREPGDGDPLQVMSSKCKKQRELEQPAPKAPSFRNILGNQFPKDPGYVPAGYVNTTLPVM